MQPASGFVAAEPAVSTSPRRSPLVIALAVSTAVSGVLTLYSLIQSPVSSRLARLYEIFPLEFVNLSRFMTLVLGFALVLSSLNLFRRKRRAYHAVVVLACLSIVFHLTKGVDYEHALLSLLLILLLVAGRRHFTVRSGRPVLRPALLGVGAALAVGIGYGVLGFWLLDPREFGIDFTMGEAVRQTLRGLSLAGDPRLVPHTRHAAWFLDSLPLMSATVVVYALTLLFRPVLYRLRVAPQERTAAGEIVHQLRALVARLLQALAGQVAVLSIVEARIPGVQRRRRLRARYWATLSAPTTEIESTVREFGGMCAENGWGYAFYETLPDFLPIYERCGLAKLKLGEDAIVDLRTFTLEGRQRKSLREAVRRVERQGFDVRQYEPPLGDELLAELESVSNDWLTIPGRRERQFTLGRFDRDYVRLCTVLVAADKDGRVQAFVNSIPSYRSGETTIDLMRRRSLAPNGVMDFLLVNLLQASRDRGFDRFSLGLAPMTGFLEQESASPEERAIHFFFKHLTFIFSFGGIRAYKGKFATGWEPRYIVYRNVLDLPRVAVTLARVSEIR